MIAVDTSAMIAILGAEPDARAFVESAGSEEAVFMSAGTAIELNIVARAKWGEDRTQRLEALLFELVVTIVSVDEVQVRLACEGYRRFGRSSGNRAKLNYGDCFSDALARSLDAPLLYRGDDLVHTDVRSALESLS